MRSVDATAYRRAPTRLSIMRQIDDLDTERDNLHALIEGGSLHVRGAALVTAHAALVLAVTRSANDDDRMFRSEAIKDALPVLARAGFGHVEPLVRAALTCDVDAARLARGVERPQ